jgi:integrase
MQQNTVQPIRDVKKIDSIKRILWTQNLRDWLLFSIGINSGLRVSDLLKLKVKDVLNSKGKINEYIIVKEQKTGKGKRFPINKTSQKAIREYLASREYNSDTYLFESRKKDRDGNSRPISRIQAYEIINSAARRVGIEDPIGTHTMRKTFGYHAYHNGCSVELLQQIFNHAAPSVTLRYIGITQDDIDNVYFSLEL